MERHYRVRTPEMVEFSFPVAGLASRFLAWLVDCLLIALVGVAGAIALSVAGVFAAVASSPNVGMTLFAIGLVAFCTLTWAYFVVFEAFQDGRTPGKRFFSLRTISDGGVRLSLAQAAIRNLFRGLDWLPGGYLLGALSHGLSESGKRVGDYVAGTVVVREERRDVPKRIGFQAAKYNSFIEDPALAQRISRSIRAEEREVLLELLLRRDELELATRTDLFQTLAKHFADKLELPNARFLSDEKIVLNVAQAIVEGERRRVLTTTPSERVPVAHAAGAVY